MVPSLSFSLARYQCLSGTDRGLLVAYPVLARTTTVGLAYTIGRIDVPAGTCGIGPSRMSQCPWTNRMSDTATTAMVGQDWCCNHCNSHIWSWPAMIAVAGTRCVSQTLSDTVTTAVVGRDRCCNHCNSHIWSRPAMTAMGHHDWLGLDV